MLEKNIKTTLAKNFFYLDKTTSVNKKFDIVTDKYLAK